MASVHNPAFVADRFIEPSPPPAGLRPGPIGWAKTHLFGGPINSIVTVAILVGIAALIPGIVQWVIIDAVVSAGSRSECLEMGDGACWAVIVARFDQFLYGFYPREAPYDLLWRPNLAFLLLLVAVAFALFDEMPYVPARTWEAMRPYGLAYAACYPFIAYWLIWGGSVWDPLLLLAAPAVGYAAMVAADRYGPKVEGVAIGAIVSIIAALVWVFVLMGPIADALTAVTRDVPTLSFLVLVIGYAVVIPLAPRLAAALPGEAPRRVLAVRIAAALVWTAIFALLQKTVLPSLAELAPGTDHSGPFYLEMVESKALGGFLLALIIGVAGITLSLPIGILLALGRRSNLFFIQTICTVFIEFIRGVPLITLLFIASSVLSYLFPPEASVDIILRVVIMVTAFASAYMAEVIRGGLASLPPGQYEAADAMGLTYWQSMRLIILPQALKQSIPNIVSTFIGLFKDTTLVFVIGLLDVIGLITNIRADSTWNGIIWEFYVFAGLFFFVICFAMSRYSMYLERKLATDRR